MTTTEGKVALQEVTQPKVLEVAAKYLPQFEEGILVICEETKEEEKIGEDNHNKVKLARRCRRGGSRTLTFRGKYK